MSTRVWLDDIGPEYKTVVNWDSYCQTQSNTLCRLLEMSD